MTKSTKAPRTKPARKKRPRERALALFASGVEKESLRFSGYEVDSVCRVLREYFGVMKYGGSKCGVMYDVAEAFGREGGRIISAYPTWLEDHDYVADFPEKVAVTNLHERKIVLLEDIDCILCYPGGIGTLDELVTFLARAAVREDTRDILILLYDFNGLFAPFRLMLKTFEVFGLAAETYPKLHYFAGVDQLRRILEQEYK